jgi:hypothetical protein
MALSSEPVKCHVHHAQGRPLRAQNPPNLATDACSVCGCTRLLYEPPVLYCTMCALKIKRGQTYYATAATSDKSDVRGCWCHTCFTEAKERVTIPGVVGT